MVVINLMLERNRKVLRQRVISAVILAVFFILIATQSSEFVFSCVMACIILIASWEWAALIGLIKDHQKISFVAAIAMIISFLYFFLDISYGSKEINADRVIIILCLGLIFWVFSIYLLYGYPGNLKIWNHPSKIAIMGLMALVPAWCAIIQLKYIYKNVGSYI